MDDQRYRELEQINNLDRSIKRREKRPYYKDKIEAKSKENDYIQQQERRKLKLGSSSSYREGDSEISHPIKPVKFKTEKKV